MTSPDDALRRYRALAERMTGAASARYTVVMGVSLARKCVHCGHKRRVYRPNRRERHTWRCARCRAYWPRTDVEVPKRGRKGGVGEFDRHQALSELADLERLITPAPREIPEPTWLLFVAIWAAVLDGHSLRATAEAFAHDLRRAGIGTSHESVRRIVERCRGIVRERVPAEKKTPSGR